MAGSKPTPGTFRPVVDLQVGLYCLGFCLDETVATHSSDTLSAKKMHQNPSWHPSQEAVLRPSSLGRLNYVGRIFLSSVHTLPLTWRLGFRTEGVNYAIRSQMAALQFLTLLIVHSGKWGTGATML